jgi:uncharacterized protein (TIGR02217 family)
MNIDNVKLPDDVERGAKGGPGFLTTIVTLANGNEETNQEWSVARGAWDIGYGIRDRSDLQGVIDFFYARRGRARGFRFKDWLDFNVTAEPVGTTGDPLTRQLQKTYPDTVNAYTRALVLPVAASLIVYVDNIALDAGDFILLDNGVLQFETDPGVNVKATFDFDVPARFDVDNLEVALAHFDAGSIPNIPIVELKTA